MIDTIFVLFVENESNQSVLKEIMDTKLSSWIGIFAMTISTNGKNSFKSRFKAVSVLFKVFSQTGDLLQKSLNQLLPIFI